MRKSELEIALDDHLRANQTIYQDDPSLSDYYKRLGQWSPVKGSTVMVKSEAPEKKVGRKRSKIAEDTGATLVNRPVLFYILLTLLTARTAIIPSPVKSRPWSRLPVGAPCRCLPVFPCRLHQQR